MSSGIAENCWGLRCFWSSEMRYLSVLILAFSLSAGEVGSVVESSGGAEIVPAGDLTAIKPATVGTPVSEGDLLQTGQDGILAVGFYDESFVKLGPDSTLKVTRKSVTPKTVRTLFGKREVKARDTLLELTKGWMRARIRKFKRKVDTFEVMTPVAVAAVRGTDFLLIHRVVTRLVVFAGRVALIPIEAFRRRDTALIRTIKKGNEAQVEEADQAGAPAIRKVPRQERKALDSGLPLPRARRRPSARQRLLQSKERRLIERKTEQTTRERQTESTIIKRERLPRPPDPP